MPEKAASGAPTYSAATSRVVRQPDAQQDQAVAALKRKQPSAMVNWDQSVGTPSQVSAKQLGVQTLSAAKGARSKAVDRGTYAERAVAVMDNLGPLFRIKDAAADFKASKVADKDRLGFRHQRLGQFYRSIPVVGGEVIVHFNAKGEPYRVDGRYVPDISVSTSPSITGEEAVAAAETAFAAMGYSGPEVQVAEKPELVVFARGSDPALAYQLVLRLTAANAWRFWIDATTGQVLSAESRVCRVEAPTSTGGVSETLSGNRLAGEGGARESFDGWSENGLFYMYAPSNFYFVYNNAGGWGDPPPAPEITTDRISVGGPSATAVYTDADSFAYRDTAEWGTSDPVEVSIAVNMQASFRYYADVHGRDGYDGNGTVVPAVAHYDLDYVNAFWDGTGMYFGDGDGTTANSLAVADVCGHELTHGVTETSANLVYQGEPGALNESFSDIFGTLIEFYSQPDGSADYPAADPGTGDWLCGEDCWLEGTALRDLRNPSSTVTLARGYQQPSKYKGAYWQDTSDVSDNGGVHQNSGVQNFFFYLLCEGGAGVNGGISYTFKGIGIENAEQVAYRTLTEYCTPDTDYKTVQSLWLAAAEDLDPAWVPAVRAAWRAVGIGITSPLAVKTKARFLMAPYRITAPDAPSSFDAVDLPPGLSVNKVTGVITGTPTTQGEFDTVISATTGGVTFTDTVHFSITDPSAPVVSIDSPISGAKFPPGRPVKIKVTATDLNEFLQPGTIVQVELHMNGVTVGTDTSAPYEFYFTPPALGNYELTAIATDADGKIGVSEPVDLVIGYLQPGELDYNFTPPSANDYVQALSADDPEGRIYLGGRFTQLNGADAPRVARLLPDGSVDPLFYVGTGPDAQVRALLQVPQDKGLYVGGHFASFDGTARRALVRLRTGQAGYVDGSLDSGFAPVIEGPNAATPPYIRAIVRQDDGNILIGGSFSKVNGTSRPNLARLRPDGTLDETFAPNPGGAVHCIALQPDGKILAGGSFSQIAGQNARRIARLNRSGTLDTTFGTGTGTTGGFDGVVNSIAVTLDGAVIAGGAFTSYNGRGFYNNMAKLLPTGAVDGKFNFTPGLNGVVNDLHIRPSGEVLVSGLFTQVANNVLGIASTAVGRVVQMLCTGAENGALDPGFNPDGAGANNSILDSITLPNGDILLAGAFTTFNGAPMARLAVVAGFDQSAPAVVSPSFFNINAGGDLDFTFVASGTGPFTFSAIGPLLRGVTLDPDTGKLSGVPLDAGSYEFQITATSAQGASPPVRFVLGVNNTKVPYEQWRKLWFPLEADRTNDAVSGRDALLNTAGLENLLVYALSGGDPRTAPDILVPVVEPEIAAGQRFLTLTTAKYPGADVIYRVEVSNDLINWRWESPADVVVVSETATQLKVRAAVPTTEVPAQFLRLKVLAP